MPFLDARHGYGRDKIQGFLLNPGSTGSPENDHEKNVERFMILRVILAMGGMLIFSVSF